ncbi:C2H2 finger domain protein [Ilyonectria robusta]|uniref:C2H2 finger domain protein n=1 Tax=Ilyonectria robusta TaxID=1079257 RepID=UPI001E8EEB2E|nr:C2H2 finger domain protein [Ilyonectria robusta]KAH8659526.1 C2H2 finger domain protein [Ilyonectria robusta]
MAQQKSCLPDSDDSDASTFDYEDIFDVDKSQDDPDTDITDFEDSDNEYDVEDQLRLFDGNTHPVEYYRQLLQNLNEKDLECQDYSQGTNVLLDGIEAYWSEFCSSVLEVTDYQEHYKSISLRLLRTFFDWLLGQKTSPNGRKKRGIRKLSSLGTYWKVFRLAFERAVGEKICPKLTRGMHKVLRALGKDHNLSSQRRMNRCMTIDNLKEQIKTVLSTTKKSFKLGEIRIYLVLFLLLMAPAGSRPTSILRLRYGDIRLVRARDPEGGPHNTLIQFSLEFTKTYLGEKETKTFTIPEIIFDPSLMLSPHAFLLGILFRHQAFQSPSLTSSQQLDKLDIHPGEFELPLPLRDDLKDVCIFRRPVETLTGYSISPDQPISYQMMANWIRRIGVLLGIEYPTISYNLRYNAANSLDQSGDISSALRNLTLDHADSTPFQRNYLTRNVSADIWGIIRGQTTPQHALVKQACSLGHSMSKRRPTDLTPEQAASINTNPEIKSLKRDLRKFPLKSEERKKGQRRLNNAKQRLRRSLCHDTRHRWTDEQANADIEHQLNGGKFPSSTDLLPESSCRPQLPAQKRLLQALESPMATTLKGQLKQRNDVIDAIIAFCPVEEGCTQRQIRTSAEVSTWSMPASQLHSFILAIIKSVIVTEKDERPTRCYLCIGIAMDLSFDDPRIDDLTRDFHSSTDLSKHLKRKHWSKLRDDEKSNCNICKITLDNKMHAKSHARAKHGSVSPKE